MNNMKPIKYKAWHKEEKKMYEVMMIDFLGKRLMLGGTEKRQITKQAKLEDVVMLEFTGLKDKNGVDIFEGDLVKSESHEPSVYDIKFIEGGFCATHPNLEGYPTDINHFYPSTGCEIQIVGDIFNNQELISGGAEKNEN